MNAPEYITQLTPQLLRHYELQVSLQRLILNENSIIPYFAKEIPYSDEKDHIECGVLKFPSKLPR